MDKNEEALAELDNAAAAVPEALPALKLRAQILFQMKRYDDAIPGTAKGCGACSAGSGYSGAARSSIS